MPDTAGLLARCLRLLRGLVESGFVKFVLLVLALASLAAAAVVGGDRGAADWATLGLAAFALVLLTLARLTPVRKARRNLGEGAGQPAARRRELEGLAGNLEQVAASRAAPGLLFPASGAVSLRLVKTGRNRIAVIKALREHLHIGLMEAKALTDAAAQGNHPLVGEGLDPVSARALMQAVRDAGGRLEPEGGP